jgi:hypothetical protein
MGQTGKNRSQNGKLMKNLFSPLFFLVLICILVTGYLLFFGIMVGSRILNDDNTKQEQKRESIKDLDNKKAYCFKKVDRNKDGQIDRVEFPFPAKFFDRFDRDRNGTLNREEWN